MSISLARCCTAVVLAAFAGGCCKPENKADMKVIYLGDAEVMTMASVRTTAGLFGLELTKTSFFEGYVPIPADGAYHFEWWTASGRVIRGDCVAKVAPGHVLLVAVRLDPLKIECGDAGRD